MKDALKKVRAIIEFLKYIYASHVRNDDEGRKDFMHDPKYSVFEHGRKKVTLTVKKGAEGSAASDADIQGS